MKAIGLVWLACALASPLSAQTRVDPSGHWRGAIQAPGTTVDFELDLATSDRGPLVGALSVPAQQLRGLPLTKIAVDGRSIAFEARHDQPFTGTIADDGATMAGDFLFNGNSVPFTLTRAGDARIDPPAKSAPVAGALEGTWNGVLEANGLQARLVLTVANQPGGFALGRLVNLDEGSLEIPVTVTQKGSDVILDTTVIPSSVSLTLNAAGTELAGTFTQGAFTAPLTFRREKP